MSTVGHQPKYVPREQQDRWKDKLKIFFFYFSEVVNLLSFFLGYNAPSESQESKAPPNKDPSTWSVEDVVWFVRDADPQALGPHSDVFRKHVIVVSVVLSYLEQMALSGLVTFLLSTLTYSVLSGDRWKRSVAPKE